MGEMQGSDQENLAQLNRVLEQLQKQQEQSFQDIKELYALRQCALMDPQSFLLSLLREKKNIARKQTITPLPYVDWSHYGIDVDQLELQQPDMETTAIPPPPSSIALKEEKKAQTSLDERLQQTRTRLAKYVDLDVLKSIRAMEAAQANALKVVQETTNAAVLSNGPNVAAATTATSNEISANSGTQSMLLKALDKSNTVHYSRTRVSGAHYNAATARPLQMRIPDSDEDEPSNTSTAGSNRRKRRRDGLSHSMTLQTRFTDEVRQSKDYKYLVKLVEKRIRLQKRTINQKRHRLNGLDGVHNGYRCDACNVEPIIGLRWKCRECPETMEVDLCSRCVVKPFRNEHHNETHTFEPMNADECPILSSQIEEHHDEPLDYLDPRYGLDHK